MRTLAPASLATDIISPPRARQRNRGDRNFFALITGGVLLVPLLVLVFFIVLIAGAFPAIREFGFAFLAGKTWDANAHGGPIFGALPFVYGTLVTAAGALLIAAPIGIGVATFLSEIDTQNLAWATCVYVAAPVVAFMAPVCTMTDFAGSGAMILAMLAFLIAGGAILKWFPTSARFAAVVLVALPVLFFSARLVAGGLTFRLPRDLVALLVAAGAAILLIRRARRLVPFLLEILATIPSVVYGMWGLFVLAPWIADHVQPYAREHWQPAIDALFGATRIRNRMVPNFPLFHYPGFPTGLGVGTAILILSIMILPVIVSLSLDALRAVPNSYREAALGLGATRWEMIRMAVLPTARSGIVGACILALGRALGETMAVTMVIGNDTRIPCSIFGKGYTISSVLANEYGDADGLKLAALMELALILFILTLAVNLLARLIVRKQIGQRARAHPFHLIAELIGVMAIAGLIRYLWSTARDALLSLFRVSNTGFRRFKNRLAIGFMGTLLMICLVPLGALMYALVRQGGTLITWKFLKNLPLPPGPKEPGQVSGIGNAILGSSLLLLFSALFAVPLGMALGIYLTQRATTRLASFTRLLLDVLSGIPAIIVGVFIYAVVVRKTGFSFHLGLSTIAGAMALAMIMLPIFARAAEEALKSIPRTVDEAGLGLGLPRRTVVLRILVRAAIPATLTGLFLALARVGGEAAPLLFTTQKSYFWPTHDPVSLLKLAPLREPIASLPYLIFDYSTSPYDELKAQAWGASLVLVGIVLLIRIATHAYTAWRFGEKATHV